MQTLHFSTFINAPREKVWDVMLGDATYREWTKPFNAGSYYEGSWEQGSKILFKGTNDKGEVEGGMVSRIAESRKPEFVSIEHMGMIVDGKEVMIEDTEEYKAWAGAHENYTFTEKDGGTDLTVDLDVTEEMAADMGAMWEKSLVVLKGLAEQSAA